jgi:hypothetical protein
MGVMQPKPVTTTRFTAAPLEWFWLGGSASIVEGGY